MGTLEPSQGGRFESVFVGPSAADVVLACAGRIHSERDKGRPVLVVALYDGSQAGEGRRAVEALRAEYQPGGLRSVRDRRGTDRLAAIAEREPADDASVLEAARLLSDVLSRTQPVNVFAPLGMGAAVDGRIVYEAAVRALASETGRNLFLYEERPEAFVPGSVRTRLALLGARLPPAAQGVAERAGLWRFLFRLGEPLRLRAEVGSLGERLAFLRAGRRRHREARRWNPARALGPRLQPVVHLGDEQGLRAVREAARRLLPRDAKGRPRRADKFEKRLRAAAKRLGSLYYAERAWLFLPSGEGIPENQHLLDLAGD